MTRALSLLLLLAGCTDGKDDPTTDPAADADGDGFSADAGDCDDANEDVNPGAAEACDGVDNDCNTLVDEGCPDGDLAVGYLDDLPSVTYAVMDAHFCLAEPVTVEQDMVAHTLGFAVQPDGAGDKFHLALYSDAANRPDALLASILSVTAVDGANEYELAEPVSVPAGTVWLTVCNEEPYNSGVIAGVLTPIAIFGMTDFADGPPDPFPATGGPPTTNTLVLWMLGSAAR